MPSIRLQDGTVIDPANLNWGSSPTGIAMGGGNPIGQQPSTRTVQTTNVGPSWGGNGVAQALMKQNSRDNVQNIPAPNVAQRAPDMTINAATPMDLSMYGLTPRATQSPAVQSIAQILMGGSNRGRPVGAPSGGLVPNIMAPQIAQADPWNGMRGPQMATQQPTQQGMVTGTPSPVAALVNRLTQGYSNATNPMAGKRVMTNNNGMQTAGQRLNNSNRGQTVTGQSWFDEVRGL